MESQRNNQFSGLSNRNKESYQLQQLKIGALSPQSQNYIQHPEFNLQTVSALQEKLSSNKHTFLELKANPSLLINPKKNNENKTNYTSGNQQHLKVLSLSWNMKGKYIEDGFQQFLAQKSSSCSPDIITISTQQCTRSILSSFCCSSQAQWQNFLRECLAPQYYIINSHTMNAMNLCLFATAQVAGKINQSEKKSIPTGFLCGCLGNKGGIAITLEINKNLNLLFINCHLPSGQSGIQERRKAFKTIFDSLGTGKHQVKEGVEREEEKDFSIVDKFQFIFWCGDFNSRIGLNSKEEVEKKIEEGDWVSLIKKDHLFNDRTQFPHVYDQFKEGIILFPPTYKLESNSNRFNKKVPRVPGWTDRILFYQKQKNSLQLKKYDSGHEVFGSDHRPVYAQFQLFVDTTHQETEKQFNSFYNSQNSQIDDSF